MRHGISVGEKRTPSATEMNSLISGWHERLSLMQNNFELIEPLLSLGTVLLKILGKEEYLPAQLLTFAQLARKAECFQIAANCLHRVCKLLLPLKHFHRSLFLSAWY